MGGIQPDGMVSGCKTGKGESTRWGRLCLVQTTGTAIAMMFIRSIFCRHQWQTTHLGTITILKCRKCRKTKVRQLADFY